MLSFMFGFIGAAISLIGWFAFHSLPLLIVGTLFYVIETIIEWRQLNAGAKTLDILIFGIGAFISLFLKTPFYICGLLALNIYSALVHALGLPSYIKMTKFFFTVMRGK